VRRANGTLTSRPRRRRSSSTTLQPTPNGSGRRTAGDARAVPLAY
jgi:hypothetical protein